MSTVLAIRPALHVDDRAFAAMLALGASLHTLDELVSESQDALAAFLPELDNASRDISLLRARLRMKQSTVNLCSRFGKAP